MHCSDKLADCLVVSSQQPFMFGALTSAPEETMEADGNNSNSGNLFASQGTVHTVTYPWVKGGGLRRGHNLWFGTA